MTAYADVERIAKALCAHEYSDDTRWDKLGETETDAFRMYRENGNEGPLDSREDFRESARAALSAMPSPDRARAEAIEECAKVCEWRGAQFAALIAAGKGEHGRPGYVRDAAWLSWMEKREMCRELVDRIRSLKAQPAATGWNFDMSAAPRDKTVLVYAAEYEGLSGFQSTASWHPDAGWCVDELRPVVAWRFLPSPPSQGSGT